MEGEGDTTSISNNVTIFLCPYPIAQPVHFERMSKKLSPETLEQLTQLTNKRGSILNFLATNAVDSAITATSEYLPQLRGLISAVNELDPAFKSYFKTGWTPSLSTMYSKKPIWSDNAKLEELFMYLVFGLLHRSKAYLVLQGALPATYEASAREAAKLLCTGAGIFNHIRDFLLPEFGPRPREATPELSATLYDALSQLSLAEAQLLTLKTATIKGMSKGALGKVGMAASQVFFDTYKLLQGIPEVSAATVHPPLVSYVYYCGLLYQCLARYYVGSTYFEQGKYSEAIGFIHAVRDNFVEFPTNSKSLLDSVASFVRVYNENRETIMESANSMMKDNDTIYYALPMPPEELPTIEGKLIAKPIQFIASDPVPISLVVKEGCILQ